MHVRGIEEVLGVYRRLSGLGKRPKAFRAPVGDNPSTGGTVAEQGSLVVCSSLRDTVVYSLLCRCRIGRIVVRLRAAVYACVRVEDVCSFQPSI